MRVGSVEFQGDVVQVGIIVTLPGDAAATFPTLWAYAYGPLLVSWLRGIARENWGEIHPRIQRQEDGKHRVVSCTFRGETVGEGPFTGRVLTVDLLQGGEARLRVEDQECGVRVAYARGTLAQWLQHVHAEAGGEIMALCNERTVVSCTLRGVEVTERPPFGWVQETRLLFTMRDGGSVSQMADVCPLCGVSFEPDSKWKKVHEEWHGGVRG